MSLELQNFDTETKKINSWNLTYTQKVNILYPGNLRELKKNIKTKLTKLKVLEF